MNGALVSTVQRGAAWALNTWISFGEICSHESMRLAACRMRRKGRAGVPRHVAGNEKLEARGVEPLNNAFTSKA